jgi:hypothetical protein
VLVVVQGRGERTILESRRDPPPLAPEDEDDDEDEHDSLGPKLRLGTALGRECTARLLFLKRRGAPTAEPFRRGAGGRQGKGRA